MTQTAQAPILSVRDVDPDLWKQLRIAALEQNVKVGELLNQILRDYLTLTHKDARP
jgi:hypothetical protein